ncbi:Cut9-interacting protein scn1 [Neocucurbitaria cava]|uniref:Cut9-interacting protein scn1 n=1 Tax=Neocucurbitaria cava TaxID=798079 RepID=A0A9W9CIV1_9PLEO|nr:Cut9-interacting protein scn1 [Neocucurbitaria cava]
MPAMSSDNKDQAFPWHLGVYDAHCHPTDTMASIEIIQKMKARMLTVMATRAEDQDLVTSTADKHSCRASVGIRGFSHQMYINDENAQDDGNSREQEQDVTLKGDAKVKHYQQVLQPSRSDPLSDEDRQIFLSLPDPTSFATFLQQTRKHLQKYPYALIGEIGLDRSFRIPEAWNAHLDLWSKRNANLTPGGREGRRLTPFRCSPQHQKKIFKLQLQLAAQMERAVSVHGVQAHGLVFEALSELWKGHEKEVLSKRERKKRGQDHPSVESAQLENGGAEKEDKPKPPYPPRICLHSYSGNASNFKQYLNPAIPTRIFASFSTAINLSDAMDEETPASFEEIVRTVPDDMVLVESDLHTAGDEMDRRLEDIIRRICKIKEWSLEEGVDRLGKNWKAFAFGQE